MIAGKETRLTETMTIRQNRNIRENVNSSQNSNNNNNRTLLFFSGFL